MMFSTCNKILRAGFIGGIVSMILLVGLMASCSNQQSADKAEIVHGEGDGHDHGTSTGHASDTTLSNWCVEHAVPESNCTRCHPELIDGFKERNDWCAEHGIPESNCRLCNPALRFPQEGLLEANRHAEHAQAISVELYHRPNKLICATDGAIIRFANASTAERAGVSAVPVLTSKVESVVDAPAEVLFDETESYAVTTTIPSTVVRWLVSPGEPVNRGQRLAVVQSPEIATLMSDYISSQAEARVEKEELKRFSELVARNLISQAESDRQKAKTEAAVSRTVGVRGLLIAAGIDSADCERILATASVTNQFEIRAPMSGIVTARYAQQGVLQEPGRSFLQIANPRSLWIEAQLTESQLRSVSVGQLLIFGFDENRGASKVGAKIIWKSDMLDPHTRTGTIRAQVVDQRASLHAGEFGRVKISISGEHSVKLVPKGAVQWEGCCNVVFVQDNVQTYRPRKVTILESDGQYYQIADGLNGDERVVESGAFLLKTELRKSSLGAGCCAIEPAG